MALRDTIGRALQALARQFGETDPKTTADDSNQADGKATKVAAGFRVESNRRSVILDARDMYDNDPRVERILSTLAKDATHGGFIVEVTEAPTAAMLTEAQEAVDELIERLELKDRLDDWARLSFRDGDSFLEVGVAADSLVHQVTRKPTLEVHRNSNKVDEFDDPTRAYWMSDQHWAIAPPADAVWFSEWQILHARWEHDEGSRYGRPLFKSARTPYKRMREGEFDLAVRRKTRAGMKFLHVIEGADAAAIEAYRKRNKDALDDPFAAVADFFSSSAGSIQSIQGDARLGEINDVLHQIETFWVASPVPMSLIGYGKDLNRDVLEEQKEQYDEALPSVTRWIETNLLSPLVELQWMLLGLWPGEIEWRVVWDTKQVLVAEDVERVGKAVSVLQSTALLDEETLLDVIGVFLPNIDLTRARDTLEERIRDEQARMETAALMARQALQGDDEEDEEDEDDEEEDEEGLEERGVFQRLGSLLRDNGGRQHTKVRVLE